MYPIKEKAKLNLMANYAPEIDRASASASFTLWTTARILEENCSFWSSILDKILINLSLYAARSSSCRCSSAVSSRIFLSLSHYTNEKRRKDSQILSKLLYYAITIQPKVLEATYSATLYKALIQISGRIQI